MLEWSDRLNLSRTWQKEIEEGRAAEVVTELRRRGVTHLVVPAGQTVAGDGIEMVYENKAYRVYRLSTSAK